jgi:hypothetical protein
MIFSTKIPFSFLQLADKRKHMSAGIKNWNDVLLLFILGKKCGQTLRKITIFVNTDFNFFLFETLVILLMQGQEPEPNLPVAHKFFA